MADTNAPPSQNPADNDILAGMMKLVATKIIQGLDDMLPARVIAYDRTTNRATVQPIIMVLTTDDQTVSRAQVASIPVLQFGAGGFILSNNLKPGDLGWIKANDRDITLFLQNYKETGPHTLRKHSFEDALFIPDPMRGYTIAAEDAQNCVLQSLDGSVKVSLGSNSLTLAAPLINIESAAVAIVGASVTHNGVNIGSTHVHGGVMSGGSNTAGPH